MFTLPPQGDNVSQRDGDQITIKKIVYNLQMAGADATNIVRVIIFRWSQNNNATVPAVTDVLQSLSPVSMYNYTNERSGKVHVLFDRTASLSLEGTNCITWRGALWGRKIGKKRLIFNATAINGVDQPYILFISDSVAVTHPSITGTLRMEYVD